MKFARLLGGLAAVATCGLLSATGVSGQAASSASPIQTVPESSGFTAVSRAADVAKLLTAASAAAPSMLHVTTIGTSAEHRDIPLVVAAPDLADGSAATVAASQKLRVWVRAGLHGDDADGTEAALALVRDLAAGAHREWFTSIVLLVTPVLNPDGHERVAPDHLNGRNGPASGVGQRTTSTSVDLDHDYVRLDTPESRTLARFLHDYDPQVTIEVRTGDNPCAGGAITFAPPLDPNVSERVLSTLRDDWIPFVAKALKSRANVESSLDGRPEGDAACVAGVAAAAPPPAATKSASGPAAASSARGRGGRGATPPAGRGRAGARGAAPAPAPPPEPETPGSAAPEPPPPAWTSLPDAPRTAMSYVALRNRFVLAGQSDGFSSFQSRVKADAAFLEHAISYAYAASSRFDKACQTLDADLIVGSQLATSWQPMTSGRLDVVRGLVETAPGGSGHVRAAAVTTATMTDRVWFQPGATEAVGAEYYIPEELTAVIDLLQAHGIQLRQLTQPARGIEQFTISSAATGALVDGHTLRVLTGAWQAAPAAVSVPAGTWVVRMNQRLARLAFSLIEPASHDGLAAWGLLDDRLKDTKVYPILRKR